MSQSKKKTENFIPAEFEDQRGSENKECPCNAGDPTSIPGSGRSSGEGNENPLQYSCLEIPWTEKPGKELDMTKATHTHVQD